MSDKPKTGKFREPWNKIPKLTETTVSGLDELRAIACVNAFCIDGHSIEDPEAFMAAVQELIRITDIIIPRLPPEERYTDVAAIKDHVDNLKKLMGGE